MLGFRNVTFVIMLAVSLAFAGYALQDTQGTPSEQYELLLKERDELPDALSKAITPEERRMVTDRMVSLPQRFLELAEKNPRDPVPPFQAVGLYALRKQ